MNDVPVFFWITLAGLMLWGRLSMFEIAKNFKFLPHMLIVMMALIATTAFVNPQLGPKLYPILMSLGFSFLFGISLIFPPTLVERIASLREGPLPEKAIIYTRKVTILWTCTLLINAAISAWTALYVDMNIWTLWNGLLSYIFIGTVFGVEYIVRQKVRAQ